MISIAYVCWIFTWMFVCCRCSLMMFYDWCECVMSVLGTTKHSSAIDDSTPVSQSRHTLRFQPIACRSIMRCPRVLTRPEIVWQAFVPDIASGQLAVFDMAEKTPGKRTCCYGQ